MTTARDIVERAYRKIALKSEDTAITGDMLEHGLEALNSMMFGWKLFGIDTSHLTLVASSTFPLDAEYEQGTVYQLAAELSPDYLVPAPASDRFFRALQAAYLTIDEATITIIKRPAATTTPAPAGTLIIDRGE